MNAAGAAIATVAAQAVSVVFALVLLFKRKLPFKITKKDFSINRHCRRALKVGLPLALQELVRIYENLVRLGNIDRKRMIAVAAKRGIQCDLRFIAEAKFVTGSARKFVEILERDE